MLRTCLGRARCPVEGRHYRGACRVGSGPDIDGLVEADRGDRIAVPVHDLDIVMGREVAEQHRLRGQRPCGLHGISVRGLIVDQLGTFVIERDASL
jgi:hypothetical protein